ncbi:hypothetical protein CALCODRAFT_504134 [Calocera cornea HHB12733]|uniref:F-box domain-containing protein n=1 Tax=Calocera cornea HHB12733 TaxID=1353952 RepID=A0A165CKD9_9BASI|nr:hypothetical protein CALCODRAFT_504134 [Calocera cornea HHB12733]
MSIQLPDELLLQIFELLPRYHMPYRGGYEHVYRNIALSCRRFYSLIRPFAWRTITLYGMKTLRQQALAICRRLKDDPGLASAVRSLTLISWDLGPDAIYLARAGQLMPAAYLQQEIAADISRESSRTVVYDAVAAMCKLEKLHAERCAFISPFEQILGDKSALTELSFSGCSFHTNSTGHIKSKLSNLSINGGSEDQSYITLCLELAESPSLRSLELVKTFGSAGTILLPGLSKLHFPSLESFTLNGVTPVDVPHICTLFTANPHIKSLALFMDKGDSAFIPSLNPFSQPWRQLETGRPTQLTQFTGPAGLAQIFIPGCPVVEVTILDAFQAFDARLDARGLAERLRNTLMRSTKLVKKLTLNNAIRLLSDPHVRDILPPAVEELHVIAQSVAMKGGLNTSTTPPFDTDAASKLVKDASSLLQLHTLILAINWSESEQIGNLQHQRERVLHMSHACPSVNTIQLAPLVRWRRAAGVDRDGLPDWRPEVDKDTILKLTQYSGKRKPMLLGYETVDWKGCIERYMRTEGYGREFEEWRRDIVEP